MNNAMFMCVCFLWRYVLLGPPSWHSESACNAEDVGSIPGSGRSAGK